jgi:hypothetical protein
LGTWDLVLQCSLSAHPSPEAKKTTYFLLSSVPHNIPLKASKEKGSACYAERRKTKREERDRLVVSEAKPKNSKKAMYFSLILFPCQSALLTFVYLTFTSLILFCAVRVSNPTSHCLPDLFLYVKTTLQNA